MADEVFHVMTFLSSYNWFLIFGSQVWNWNFSWNEKIVFVSMSLIIVDKYSLFYRGRGIIVTAFLLLSLLNILTLQPLFYLRPVLRRLNFYDDWFLSVTLMFKIHILIFFDRCCGLCLFSWFLPITCLSVLVALWPRLIFLLLVLLTLLSLSSHFFGFGRRLTQWPQLVCA